MTNMVYGEGTMEPPLSLKAALSVTCAGGCAVDLPSRWDFSGPQSFPRQPRQSFRSLGRAAGPWAQTAPPPGLAEPESFDAFSKGDRGDGKGKDRGPLECDNCVGKGHPPFKCTSPYWAGQAKAGQRCKNCDAFGRDIPTCASKGGGEYTSPNSKGKEKGASKGGKSQWQPRSRSLIVVCSKM